MEVKLRRAWHKERRYFHTRGLCHLILWAVAMILLDFTVDWLLEVPGAGRVALLAVNVAAMGWVLYRRWWRYLRPFNPARVALQVENRHPELKSLLVSYVQLRGTTSGTYVSPSLINAMRRQAVEVTDPLNFKEIVNYRELKRVFLFSAVVLLVFAAGSVNWPQYLRALAYRMLNPSSNLKYPTRTQLEPITTNATIRQGDNVTVAARASGWVPQRGTLYLRPESSATWQKLDIAQDRGRGFSRRFEEVYEGFEYYFKIGDAKSERFKVTVVPPPQVVEATVHLKYPQYTGVGEKTSDSLNLEVLEGTEIQWNLRCDRPVSKAEMLVVKEKGKAEPLQMRLDPAGLRAALPSPLPAKEHFSYRFRWTTREPNYVYEEDVEHFVQVTPDLPPEVEILLPATDEKATVNKIVSLTFRTVDDYGIAKSWIVYSLDDGEEKKIELPAPASQPASRASTAPTEPAAAGAVEQRLTRIEKYRWALRQTIPDLAEGKTLAFAIEVSDNYNGPKGPHIGRSQVRRIAIVSLEEYRKYILENLANLIEEIRQAHESETEGDQQVKLLRDSGNTTTSAPASQTAPVPGTTDGGGKP